MRSIGLFQFLILVALLSLSSCLSGVKKDWKTYTSAEGAFTISTLGDFEKTTVNELTPYGKQPVHYLKWKPSSFSISKIKLIQVTYTDCPAKYIVDSNFRNVMLDSAIKMRARDFSDTYETFQNIELNTYPGRTFVFDVPTSNSIAIVKLCVVNNRKYDLTMVVSRDQGSNDEQSTFFNSFSVLR